ncbi:MAG: hypothetical protein H0V56_01075 [Chthoniobacterales bacterium]|nr:hypothetical protein [Chthoniobacterales bacterium]
MPVVRANFDANAPHDAERKDDYRILISTEVLAEGVNLHRAHVVVNYDTPSNSTRLMQRIGRANRILRCGLVKVAIRTPEVLHSRDVIDGDQIGDRAALRDRARSSAQHDRSGIVEESAGRANDVRGIPRFTPRHPYPPSGLGRRRAV